MTPQDTMRLALEALEKIAVPQYADKVHPVTAAIEALKAALAQQGEQQPLQAALFDCDIQPRPLVHPLRDYHFAPSEGPLNYTWQDKPHRLLYDLIAAVRYYAAAPAAQPRTNQCGETCERAKLCAVCAGELAQQGEQPVAEVREQQYCIAPSEVKYSRTVIEMLDGVSLPHGTLLYAGAAPAAQPLTDEQIDAIEERIYCKTIQKGKTRHVYSQQFARAIERAHGIGVQK